jgi:glucose-6-phosphate isomerase
MRQQTPLTQLPAWQALGSHSAALKALHLRDLFASDPGLAERFSVEAEGLFLDYSKNRITAETVELLVQLARESGLAEAIEAMFRGDAINLTENRSVLHTALRAPKDAEILSGGVNVVPEVHAVLDRMEDFAERVRSGAWTGHTGKRIRTVVNIGIGGSDLGPVMAYEALRHYSARGLQFRFVSNVDGTDFAEATQDLDAAETLFLVASKTFTTLETMTNAQSARRWLLGEALEQGEGVEVDVDAAIDCYRAAALAGFAPAHEALARHGVYLPPPRREPEPVVGHVPDANRFLTRIEPFATTYNSPRAYAP